MLFTCLQEDYVYYCVAGSRSPIHVNHNLFHRVIVPYTPIELSVLTLRQSYRSLHSDIFMLFIVILKQEVNPLSDIFGFKIGYQCQIHRALTIPLYYVE
jgi:hypothetical protein